MSEAGVAAIRPVEGPPGHSASRDSARPGALGPRRSQVREVPALTDAQKGNRFTGWLRREMATSAGLRQKKPTRAFPLRETGRTPLRELPD